VARMATAHNASRMLALIRSGLQTGIQDRRLSAGSGRLQLTAWASAHFSQCWQKPALPVLTLF